LSDSATATSKFQALARRRLASNPVDASRFGQNRNSAILEIDRDVTDPETGNRLIRYRTTRYLPHEQRAEVRFIYDKFATGILFDHYVSDFESHVYFPRELQLLFMFTGFSIEASYGDYRGRALSSTSEHMIMMGLKDVSANLTSARLPTQ